jgi:hypothetical protein
MTLGLSRNISFSFSRGLIAFLAAASVASPALASLTITSQAFSSEFSASNGLTSTLTELPNLYERAIPPQTYDIPGTRYNPTTQVISNVTDAAFARATTTWTSSSLSVRMQAGASRLVNTYQPAEYHESFWRVQARVLSSFTFSLSTGSTVYLSYNRSSFVTTGSVTPFEYSLVALLTSLNGSTSYWGTLTPAITGTASTATVFLPAGDYNLRLNTGRSMGAFADGDIQAGSVDLTADFVMIVPSPGALALAGIAAGVAIRRRR